MDVIFILMISTIKLDTEKLIMIHLKNESIYLMCLKSFLWGLYLERFKHLVVTITGSVGIETKTYSTGSLNCDLHVPV